MSTIASPRDPAAPFPRRANSSQAITPTGSARPSLDTPRSAAGSPNPNNSSGGGNNPTSAATFPTTAATTTNKRANRAALREYYNLKRTSGASTPTLEITPTHDSFFSLLGAPPPLHSAALTSPSELDTPGFDASAYVARALADSSLAQLVGVYARVAGEMRALDAEKKALVYDNYSKLISATETIRRMRAGMDPLAPVVAGTLDPAIARVYALASGIRDALRREVAGGGSSAGGFSTNDGEEGEGDGEQETGRGERREKTRELAEKVLRVPERMRRLVGEGRLEDARREWVLPRRLLEKWKAAGFGGDDVDTLIREGDAVLGGGEDGGDTTSSRKNGAE